MKHQLTPTDLKNRDEFELLAEVDHQHIKPFIFEQISREKHLIRLYSIYQISMIALYVFILTKAAIHYTHGVSQPITKMGLALLFAFTLLIILHELIHAAAYRLRGTGKVQFGAIWSKFIFYAGVDKEVIDFRTFRFVALAPFWLVKGLCIVSALLFWTSPWAYFFISLMCIHSLFCAGDMAMLAFYRLHPDKEIYNYDDLSQQKTYFYFRKNNKDQASEQS
ncbi:DUF3267 domain-containing protein [Sunxiuqinia sp. sy24]|uniref:DUF3267 domain-containing protein n=1 Tax=Sunxiuqinia sp. sy24 TaxID=3461495 RepID=UPI004045D9E0